MVRLGFELTKSATEPELAHSVACGASFPFKAIEEILPKAKAIQGVELVGVGIWSGSSSFPLSFKKFMLSLFPSLPPHRCAAELGIRSPGVGVTSCELPAMQELGAKLS